MNTKHNKIAVIPAFIIGAMAVFAGGRVLLGDLPGYYVVHWLPIDNYTPGILAVFVTAILIWSRPRLAMPAALATFELQALVMLIPQTSHRDVAAIDSVVAMAVP